ncbi:hypothetical protein E3N88_38465 [Mikania micrantha]|uniref:ABC transmembrane type-1 domain-containing protein n=1 Tax=Mikania micrantha TaxID=192012 RepID=A0A5N6LU22_9ASTR|nr:hypothetical protein E3N88_38465 [Mikania micrantha]
MGINGFLAFLLVYFHDTSIPTSTTMKSKGRESRDGSLPMAIAQEAPIGRPYSDSRCPSLTLSIRRMRRLVSEPPESPSPYMDASADAVAPDVDDEVEEMEEIEPPPEAVPFSRLFACADRLDWVLMVVGLVAAAAHVTALVIYLHYFAKIIQLLSHGDDSLDLLFHRFKEVD